MSDALANYKLSRLRRNMHDARAAAVAAAEDQTAEKDDTGVTPVGEPGKDDD